MARMSANSNASHEGANPAEILAELCDFETFCARKISHLCASFCARKITVNKRQILRLPCLNMVIMNLRTR